MNKQQLANRIWESANKMRSKIEANEYKDYILGFIFYKYLSETEIKWLKSNDFTDEDIESLTEDDQETVEYIQKNIGYFISYDNLYSTWLKKGNKFDVSNVTDALSAFSRLISSTHKKVFENIFKTLETGLSKLGESAGARTKAISGLLQLIKDIPMDGKQDYDVLGFIYEYLISMFAANAGKKAGEFYTPHEVSLVMSEIVANHLKGRDEIKIYDPTSGSGSLLINIGHSIAKYINDANNIKYYAQELKENTYNLTRMNLVMRGIKPDNIVTRNGDTLEDDWPYFDESDPSSTYEPLYVDAVVSNPPYSQQWDPNNKENDPRYARFGLAPKSKADYAFLLHDLYHLKPDGIMTIVLPHGVLFRGGDEGLIRKNLIENNHIDTIIGLPANIFFGTGIPTIIMVLKQKRKINDVLIIDASKGFAKEGKNNKLRASDIKKIVDTVTNRSTIEKFSRSVSIDEIRENEYNMNIPRYVDSSDVPESWDIYATMNGGIPINEIKILNEYWKAFPNLKNTLFKENGTPYATLNVDNIRDTIKEHQDIIDFENNFKTAFKGFDDYLKENLISNVDKLILANGETEISDNIFLRLKDVPLVNEYESYQLLDDVWSNISTDIEIIQSEGFNSTKTVDPNMVSKKKDGKDVELQEGWKGRIIPFNLVQDTILIEQKKALNEKENRFNEINSEYEVLIEELNEEDKQILNDDNTAFVMKEVLNSLKEIMDEISTKETDVLYEYLELDTKEEKLDFINKHNEINWTEMSIEKNGTYKKNVITNYISCLKSKVKFEEGSYQYIVSRVCNLNSEEKLLKAQLKKETAELEALTKTTIENLTDDEVRNLLKIKWIDGITGNLYKQPQLIIDNFITKVEALGQKYKTTYFEIDKEINDTELELCKMIDELDGSEFDMKGLQDLKSLLGER